MIVRRKHRVMSDEGWEAFKAEMRQRTENALSEGTYRHAYQVKAQPFVVAPPNDPNSCANFCPTCHGMNYSLDPATGEVIECPNYRARLDKMGIPDPSRNADVPREFWDQ